MRYEVWMEGFHVMKCYALAECLGVYDAESFLDACQQAVKANPGYEILYDKKRNTVYGCRLFDNEADARKSFG